MGNGINFAGQAVMEKKSNITPFKPSPIAATVSAEYLSKDRKSFMAKIDEKAAEQITLRKGTLWVIGITPVFLMLVLNYGTNFIEFIRNDQSKAEQLQQIKADSADTRNRLEKMEQKLDSFINTYQQQEMERLRKLAEQPKPQQK
jgi:hypothetical protein